MPRNHVTVRKWAIYVFYSVDVGSYFANWSTRYSLLNTEKKVNRLAICYQHIRFEIK